MERLGELTFYGVGTDSPTEFERTFIERVGEFTFYAVGTDLPTEFERTFIECVHIEEETQVFRQRKPGFSAQCEHSLFVIYISGGKDKNFLTFFNFFPLLI